MDLFDYFKLDQQSRHQVPRNYCSNMYTLHTNQLTKPMSRVHICTFYDHGTGEMKPFNHLHRIHQMMN